MRHRMFLLATLAFVAIFAIPSTSQAQCTEKCVLVRDGDSGQAIGHGCISGSDGHNCVAGVYECTIDGAGCGNETLLDSPVLDEDGRQLATAKVCPAAKQVVELKLIKPVDKGRAITLPKAATNADGPSLK